MPKLKLVPNPGLYLVKGSSKSSAPPGPNVSLCLHEPLCAAIEARHQVRFLYGGFIRIVEPHDYGLQNGNPRLLAFQTGGESSHGRLPAWRWFDVDKMSNFEALGQTFPGYRPVPSGRHHRWDKLFMRVAKPE